MYEEIIISGFGGQGIVFAGQLLAYAGVAEGYHVTMIPSYGPEMRGGTAHCTVIISDEEIGSPLVRRPKAAVVLNIPSMERYASYVKPGGVLVLDSTLIPERSGRDDIREIALPAKQIAEDLGSPKFANMVMLGALAEATGVVRIATLEKMLEMRLEEHHDLSFSANVSALRRGASIAREVVTSDEGRRITVNS